MASDYGVQSTGFVTRSLSEIRDDFRASIQAQFGGTTVDLSSTGVLSQLVDVFANGLADLWAASAGIYAGAYPSGATGAQVDQLLALSGLTRIAAKATVTSPSTATDAGGNPLYGLVVYGTAGSVLPAGSLLSNGASSPTQFSTDAAITISASANSSQTVQFTNSPTSGSFALTLTTASGQALTTGLISASANATATTLIFPAPNNNDDSDWYLSVGGQTVRLAYNAAASDVQAALAGISGYSQATVTGSRAANMLISWPSVAPSATSTGTNGPSSIVASVRDAIWALTTSDGKHAFGDVTVESYGQGYQLLFGAGTQPDGAPSTEATPFPLLSVGQNSLFRGTQKTAAVPSHLVFGHPAQGTGSATATQSGPIEVLARQLTTLVQPVTGIASVTNPLDCIVGREIEDDADAISRMQSSSSQTTATLSAIVGAVQSVSGVSQAIAFANATNASEQILSFSQAPTTGNYSVSIAGQTTGSLPYSASAQDLQSALQALPGLSDVTVTTAGASAFDIRFGAQSGHLPHDLALVASNTTDVTLTPSFACPAHAVEVVAQGGDSLAIAQAILSTLPAGIASYGRQAAATTASLTSGSSSGVLASLTGAIAGQIVDAAHLPTGTQLASITGSNAVFSQAATATNASESLIFSYGAQLDDGAGNQVLVRFSRAAPVTIYANLTIVTDKSSGSQYSATSLATIQQNIIDTINAVPIGSPVLVTGTQGLLNSFRAVPGVQSASMTIGRSASSQSADALILAPNETPIASAATINIQVN